MPSAIDLNSDLGESYGPWTMGDDAAMLAVVTSANIACGFHAGDPLTMARTMRLAGHEGVAVGAHIGYADLRGFGRRPMVVSDEELAADIIYQFGAAQALAAAADIGISHVKPHGALYNALAADGQLAGVVCGALASVAPELRVFGLAGSIFLDAARAAGLAPVAEAFADRAYRRDGSLVPRHEPGSVLTDPAIIAERMVTLAQTGTVAAIDGTPVAVEAQTICVHGETPHAVAVARAVRDALQTAGIALRRVA